MHLQRRRHRGQVRLLPEVPDARADSRPEPAANLAAVPEAYGAANASSDAPAFFTPDTGPYLDSDN